MQTTEIANHPFQTKEEKEKIFQGLENDPQLFKETLEVILTLVISDPKLIDGVTDLIAADFRNLQLAIIEKGAVKESGDNSMGCCKDIF